jgi:hypothetical protein
MMPMMPMMPMIAALLLAVPPRFTGDADAAQLEDPLRAAVQATAAYGPWPPGPWEVRLHPDGAAFDRETHAPPGRAALWTGDVLHLRPWDTLRRRDLGALLRHEAVHRRLMGAGLRRWEEEARCLHAETHVRPPKAWPPPPPQALQGRLDLALDSGTTETQRWAYQTLRAWLSGSPPLPAPRVVPPQAEVWRKEALALDPGTIVVRWPPERLPRTLVVNGQTARPGVPLTFRHGVTFGPGAPVSRLPGTVELRPAQAGWSLAWITDPQTWVAAATAGEFGEDAPLEARKALAAVLRAWLTAHPRGNHPDGSLCPLTHCAVVRGQALPSTLEAAAGAPKAAPGWIWFCGSKGGVSLSPLQAWGQGSQLAPPAQAVPGDPWSAWTRTFTTQEVQYLKRAVPPGLKPGQRGLRLGSSGPYPVENLRLAAGRAFGWTRWPSNACQGEIRADGSLGLTGHGWGHNVGLCLATARYRARQGVKAGKILQEAFGQAQDNPAPSTADFQQVPMEVLDAEGF